VLDALWLQRRLAQSCRPHFGQNDAT
jgi:hypothetical protein